MKHATVLQWSPYALAELGLFDDADQAAEALRDAPVVTLAAGETLARSRSGEPLVVLPLAGMLAVHREGTVTNHEPGALLGLAEALLGSAQGLDIRAAADSVILLVDRHRLAQLSDRSPEFARRVVRDLVAWTNGRIRRPAALNQPDVSWPEASVSGEVRCVILVKLVNREALALCHGPAAAHHAMEALGEAIAQSIRPGDIRTAAGVGEYLVGIHGDMLSATIVASRLQTRASRAVVFGDMHTPLPHLQIVVGIAIPEPGETLFATAERARGSASQVARVGGVIGGGLA